VHSQSSGSRIDSTAREEASAIRGALAGARGNVNAAARALGIPSSTLWSRIARLRLRKVVTRSRPVKPTATNERARIHAALARHRGQVYRAALELGVSKGTLRDRMRRYGLFEDADALRVEANRIGPRKHLPHGRDPARRRTRLVALLETCNWKVRDAHRIAKVSAGTFYNMIHELGIDLRAETARQRLRRLIDALRVGHGVLARAARHLSLDPRTVRDWCRELDVDPRDYRPQARYIEA
jgi:transcriptional regulator with GAF, ATPase, and Fis domain